MANNLKKPTVGALTLAVILTIGTSIAWAALALATCLFLAPSAIEDNGPGPSVSAVVLPSPATFAFMRFFLSPLEESQKHSSPGFASELQKAISGCYIAFTTVCLSAAVASIVCFRRERYYSRSTLAFWPAFVLVTGLPGLIGYLLHRRWPATQ